MRSDVFEYRSGRATKTQWDWSTRSNVHSEGTTKTGYRTTPVGCRGGSRYVERCWGFPYLKIKKFLGFLVSGCGLRFVCFWFYGFMVSWFRKLTKLPVHAFRKIFIPYPRLWRCLYTDLHHLSAPVFSQNDILLGFQNSFKEIVFVKMSQWFLDFC